MVFIRSYFLQTAMYINLFTRKCFYEKKSKMRGNLDTLLQLSTSGEEVVWFHGAVSRRKKKEQKFNCKQNAVEWNIVKILSKAVSISTESISF